MTGSCNWSQCAILARGGAEGDYNKTSREKIDEYLELSSFLPIFTDEYFYKTKNRF